MEKNQVRIYICSLFAGFGVGHVFNLSRQFEAAIPAVLALMLFATFMQVPLNFKEIKKTPKKMVGALLLSQFVALPILVYVLLFFVPVQPLIQLAVLLVLLTPCIDYVITFTHLAKGNASLLLRLTPLLLVVQMVCLPFYIGLMLDMPFDQYINAWDMFYVLMTLLGIPLILALLAQRIRHKLSTRYVVAIYGLIDVLPIPTTALVLFVVLGAVVPYVDQISVYVWEIFPLYVAFAVLAPSIAFTIGKMFKLKPEDLRALVMSSAYRNSLVILPIALAIPDPSLLVPAIILLQTMTELGFLPLYLRIISAYK